ncbi:hypothetical protein HCR08_02815 [Wolbachia pipientis]|uniref:hypothetical protein n=1 Tax=Wolbachia pipientis TaxID=955 RepID=UPI0015FD0E7E|nr:hypothetical protein [Wolbachia pipientis]MBA8755013.1 hypothetical protein [Wolbachia pipientis]
MKIKIAMPMEGTSKNLVRLRGKYVAVHFRLTSIALFTIIRTDHNMLLLYHSHKHISYPIRTIARSAI